MRPALHRSRDWTDKPVVSCQLSPQISRRGIIKLLILSLPLPALSAQSLSYPELRGLDEAPRTSGEFRSVEGGLRVQDIALGDGETMVGRESTVWVKYVLRRSNGYFIDASYGFDRFETFMFRTGKGEVVEGFERGVDGMKIGGRRRFVVPASMGYVEGVGVRKPGPIPPEWGGRRALDSHKKEPLIFEVQVVRIRN